MPAINPRDIKGTGQQGGEKLRSKPPKASIDAAPPLASGLPVATHRGSLKLGDTELQAYVLNDGRRVLSGRAITKAMGLSGRGAGMQRFLDSKSLRPFLSGRLIEILSDPIELSLPGGLPAPQSFEAEVIPELCNAVLDANEIKPLPRQQQGLVATAKALSRALQGVGIIALVDEATGFQYERAKNALAEILELFVSKELARWVKTFQPEYYEELFRLRRWQPSQVANRRPPLVGKLTNDIVYERLAPGVLEELRRLTPRDEKGRLKSHLHRRLTTDIGHPALRAHLEVVVALMSISPDWATFYKHLNKVKPKQVAAPLFDEPPKNEAKVTQDEPKLAMPGVTPRDALKAFMQVDPKKVKS